MKQRGKGKVNLGFAITLICLIATPITFIFINKYYNLMKKSTENKINRIFGLVIIVLTIILFVSSIVSVLKNNF